MINTKLTRKVLITGGGSGIGAAIAKEFSDNEYEVIIIGRRKEKLINTSSQSNRINYYECDVTSESSVDEVFKKIGEFNVLINCAGIISSSEESITFNSIELNNILNTNLKASIMTSLKAIDLWKEKKIKGNIINIGSISSSGSKNFPIYASSKAGIISFTKSIASRYGEYGLRCNVISPGVIKTDMSYIETPNFDDYIEEIEEDTPLKRLGNPEDIAKVAVFLASNNANFITGQEIIVDGGYSLPKE